MKKTVTKKRLKKCDFGTTASNIAGSASAASGVVGGVIKAFDKNPDRFTKSDATGNYFAQAGNMATQLGAAGASFGPWGAVGGAVIGGALGLINAGAENKRLLQEQKSMDTVKGINEAASSLSNVASYGDIKRNKNLGIPGMDKGIYKFYSNKNNEPNAMLASEEAVISPNGNVDIIPGKYNKSNPDTTMASIQDGTSVLPKNPSFRLPGGKSTPADIAKKISRIQKNGDEIMNRYNTSFIDRNTAKINKVNTDIALDSLAIYSEAIRNKMNSNATLPKFVDGVNGFDTKKYFDINKLNEQDASNGGIITKNGIVQGDINTPSQNEFTINAKKIQTNKNNIKGISIESTNPIIPSVSSMFNDYVSKNSDKFPKGAKVSVSGSTNYSLNENGTKTENQIVKIPASNYYFNTKKVSGVGTTPTQEVNKLSGGNKKDLKFNFDANSFTRYGALATAIGGSISQMNNAVPEQVYAEEYKPTQYKYRSDLYNQLRDIQARENIARYNNRVIGSNAGIASALNSSLQRNSNSAALSAYEANNKQLMNVDNMNRSELARIYNLNMNEKAKAKDINMRNRAAARNIKYAAIQDIAKTILPRNIDGSSYRYSQQ